MCVCPCGYVHMWIQCPESPEEAIRFPRAVVTGSCKLLSVGAGDQTAVVCKDSVSPPPSSHLPAQSSCLCSLLDSGGQDYIETVIPSNQLPSAAFFSETQKQFSRYFIEFEELQLLGKGAFGAVIKVRQGCPQSLLSFLFPFHGLTGLVSILGVEREVNKIRLFEAGSTFTSRS